MLQRLKGKSALHNMNLNKIQSKMIIAIEQINEKGLRDISQRLYVNLNFSRKSLFLGRSVRLISFQIIIQLIGFHLLLNRQQCEICGNLLSRFFAKIP